MNRWGPALLLLLAAGTTPCSLTAGETEPAYLREARTSEDIDTQLAIADRFFRGTAYHQAYETYDALLSNPNFSPIPKRRTPVADEGEEEGQARAFDAADQERQRRMGRQLAREHALYFRLRARFELSRDDPAQLEELAQDFLVLARNRLDGGLSNFENPQYSADARHWAARALARAGELKYAAYRKQLAESTSPSTASSTDGAEVNAALQEAESLWIRAADQLDTLIQHGPPPSLDAAAVRDFAQIKIRLATLAELGPDTRSGRARRRQKFYQEAINQLSRVSINYPNNPYWNENELLLIELEMRSGNYQNAATRAEEFLGRELRSPSQQARAMLLRARCAYHLGQLETAIQMYERVLAREQVEAGSTTSALVGLGWAYARIGRGGGLQEQSRNLARAQAVFRRALQQMDEDDPQRDAVLMEQGSILLDLGEHKSALSRLLQVTHVPAMRERALFLAGLAARGTGEVAAAEDHFRKVLLMADPKQPSANLLEAIKNIAELESERGAFGRALLHYRDLWYYSILLRDASAVAEAGLGMAKALIGLGSLGPAEMKRHEGELLLQALSGLAREAGRANAPGLRVGQRNVAFALQALQIVRRAGPNNFRQARTLMETLRQRYSDRLRKDELDYQEGRILFFQAKQRMNDLLEENAFALKQIQEADRYFENAIEMVTDATRANPRGIFAPAANLLLGRIHHAQGLLKNAVVRHLRDTGNPEDASSYQEDKTRSLERALQPLQQAARTAAASSVRTEALMLLAKTYFALEDLDQALAQFDTVTLDPDTPEEMRTQAVLLGADALARLRRIDEAIRRLQPYANTDLRAAIQAGDLLAAGGRYREAFFTYLLGQQDRKSARSNKTDLTAEMLYKAYSLGLRHAESLADEIPAGSFREKSIAELERVASRFSQTVWAGDALTTLGRYFLSVGQAAKAVELTTRGMELLPADSTARRRLVLLRGEALQASGQMEKAQAEYEQVSRLRMGTPELKRLRAEAMRRLGDLYAERASRETNPAQTNQWIREALQQYSRVFSLFQNVSEQADLARIAAAGIHARQGRLEQALQVLDDGIDRQAMHMERQKLLKQYGGDGPATHVDPFAQPAPIGSPSSIIP